MAENETTPGPGSRRIALLAGPVVALAGYAAARGAGLPSAACSTAAVACLCATWWLTEALPIPATALIPFATLPLLGVASSKQLASAYGHPLIQLLLGGFLLASALETCGVHRRLALRLVTALGGRADRRLVLGFMLASASLSFWISNSATTLMLLPVASAVLAQTRTRSLTAPLLLGIAYAASIGGLGTPIGSPPNAVFLAFYEQATHIQLGFVDWMRLGVPAVVLLLPAAWWLLTRRMGSGEVVQLPDYGPWRQAEVRTLVVFGLTALAWVTRTAPLGGWQSWWALPLAGDGVVALLAVVVMFVAPDGEGGTLLDWKRARELPWGLLLLFGGGLALALGFETSGLSAAISQSLAGAAQLPPLLTIALICTLVTFLTELTSNTATASLLMPVLATTAQASGVEPMMLMAPAALSASCAFMLPVATAPNAIVFGSGALDVRTMARHGFTLNLIGILVLTLLTWLLV